MATLTPVDHDPFAAAPAPSSPKMTPVDNDPFASTPPAQPSKPPESFHLFGTKPMDPVFGSTVAPAINMMDYPVRAGIGDAIRFLAPGMSTDRWHQIKQQILDATALPETKVGQAVEQIASAPGTLIAKGVGGASRAILGEKLTSALAPFAETAADLAPFGLSKAIARAPKELPGLPSARLEEAGKVRTAAARLRNENRARREISDTYKQSTREGGPNAEDIIAEMNKARHAGQPMIAPDFNLALERTLGSIYRAGGGAASAVRDFLQGRDKGAAARLEGQIDQNLTDQSLRDAMKQQVEDRSARAAPVWADAMQRGTSTAPFTRHYELQLGEAMKSQAEAQVKVASAALRRAFNEGDEALSAELGQAKRDLAGATKKADDTRALLQRARDDGTLNAPGATWSPGLQRLREHYPRQIESGIRRGIEVQHKFAAGDVLTGKGFNPYDYAIVGMDAAGEPIVGAVPTMRAWHAAKVGMDEFLRSPAAYDQYGKLTAEGASTAHLRKVLVDELDRLNPKYKPARDLYAGDTAVLRAMNDGKQIFSEKRFMDDAQAREEFNLLGDSEKQAFITGVRQDLRNRLKRVSEGRDKSVVFATPLVRERLTAILGPAGDQLLDAVEREHTMRVTSNRTLRGSPTAERLESDAQRADRQVKGVVDFMRELRHPVRAVGGLVADFGEKLARSRFGERARTRQQAVNDAGARLLLDPNLVLNPTGPLLTPLPGEVSRFRPSPGAAYGIGTAITPEDHTRR